MNATNLGIGVKKISQRFHLFCQSLRLMFSMEKPGPIKSSKKPDFKEALLKAASYCAYQERCHKEVRAKLHSWGIFGQELDAILAELIKRNYLDEERFARSFAGGKFRTCDWGKMKIRRELQAREISDYGIEAGMKEINDAEYLQRLRALANKKFKSFKNVDLRQKRQLTMRFLYSKGFETELIRDIVTELS